MSDGKWPNSPIPAKVDDILKVVDRMPEGTWGYPFGTDPDTWLVPVERCGHRDEAFPNGHIEKHIITQYVGQGRHRDDIEWCPGAGIGGDDE